MCYIHVRYVLGSMYDFEVNKPDEVEEKVHYMEGVREKLRRNINTRSINLLDKEEEQYNDTLKKKRIVENDKNKILETIKHLDKQKKETLIKAWEQVYRFFLFLFFFIEEAIIRFLFFLLVNI